MLRQSAFPIHDTRQFMDYLIYNGNKLRKHSCLFHGQLTEKFSSNFPKKKKSLPYVDNRKFLTYQNKQITSLAF